MKPIVDDALLEHLCLLAKLELTDEERMRAKEDLDKMLDYIDCLEKADVASLEPLYHVLPMENVFREDVVEAQAQRAEECRLTENAPEMREGYLTVPRTIGEKGKEE